VLRECTTSRIVVANHPAAHSWFPGERIVADAEPGLGPLAGIATALAAASGAPVLVLAWDMPFVPAGLLAELRRLGDARANVDAVVPRHDGMAEPVCAWYAPSALPVCRELLAAGERRAHVLAAKLSHTLWLEGDGLTSFGDAGRIFVSVDSPDGLRDVGGARP